ncbi:hypothetical protein FALBO_14592 [Fusarium albosuccineum]|uniref:Uncharacterized protein n=1 Tax=Fusarium albosuccineum TaxID=1237068 RepID=A0A8H4KXR9_9HYPO|nr:hypothetical protein FALBO_14592 [Fusarium albosuccineum]
MPTNHKTYYATLPLSGEPVTSPDESQLWHLLEPLADPRSLEPLPQGIATFHLSEKRCGLFLKALKERPALWGLVDDKVRHDYDPSKEYLVVQTPSSLHDYLTSFIAERIQNQLRKASALGADISGFVDKLVNGRSS